MSRSAVEQILQRIDSLGKRDRLRLDQALRKRAETEWAHLARDARAQSRRRGLRQGDVDAAVEAVRYGRR